MFNNLPGRVSSGGTGALLAASPALAVHAAGEAGRIGAEGFIADVYRRRFGARVDQFAPALVTMREHGRIVAAAGYRDAGRGPLFLEQYLVEPVEVLLASHAGHAPARSTIVEVGHLAAAPAGRGRQLIANLGSHLAALGYQWVVSTATEELRRLVLRMGIAPLTLGPADPGVLGPAAVHWGSYYEHRPVVVAGRLPQVLRHLQAHAERIA